jgi:tetratricopeptide (TPR) repeat protein
VPTVLLTCAVLALLPSHLGAQRSRRAGSASSSKVQAPIRAELAAVLLQSGRYSEAAREYRLLLAREPRNRSYKLNLARALAWGNQHEEAEQLLTELHREQPADVGIVTLLRATRAAFEPRATLAATWVGDDPSYAPYRLALARALVQERMFGLATAQYDTLLSRPGYGQIPPRTTLQLELANAYASSGNRVGATHVLHEMLIVTPNDTALRHALAINLAESNERISALAEYDTLLSSAPTARLFAERARLHLALDDEPAAQADIASGLAIAPSREGFATLAELHRRHGEYAAARTALMSAIAARDTGDMPRSAVVAALASLSREMRPSLLAPVIGDDPGWSLGAGLADDNLGVSYAELSARAASRIPGALVVSAGAEARSLHERGVADVRGAGANVGVSREAAIGSFLGRASARAGVLKHQGLDPIHEWELSGAGWMNAWELAVTASQRAAYPSLFTTSALVDPITGAGPLTERSIATTLGGPLGAADVALSLERSRLSDGNTRITLQVYSRYQLSEHLFAVYSGSTQQFAERSTRYWDPLSYVANGGGAEVAVRRPLGFSFAARVIPGIAVSNELVRLRDTLPDGTPIPLPDETRRRSALQLTASSDASYRTRSMEMAGSLTYGRGRAGDYQRFGASVWLQWAP